MTDFSTSLFEFFEKPVTVDTSLEFHVERKTSVNGSSLLPNEAQRFLGTDTDGMNELEQALFDLYTAKDRESNQKAAREEILKMLQVLCFLIKNSDAQQLVTHQWGSGNSALHLSSFFGDAEMTRKLLNFGFGCDVSNELGVSARDVGSTTALKSLFVATGKEAHEKENSFEKLKSNPNGGLVTANRFLVADKSPVAVAGDLQKLMELNLSSELQKQSKLSEKRTVQNLWDLSPRTGKENRPSTKQEAKRSATEKRGNIGGRVFDLNSPALSNASQTPHSPTSAGSVTGSLNGTTKITNIPDVFLDQSPSTREQPRKNSAPAVMLTARPVLPTNPMSSLLEVSTSTTKPKENPLLALLNSNPRQNSVSPGASSPLVKDQTSPRDHQSGNINNSPTSSTPSESAPSSTTGSVGPSDMPDLSSFYSGGRRGSSETPTVTSNNPISLEIPKVSIGSLFEDSSDWFPFSSLSVNPQGSSEATLVETESPKEKSTEDGLKSSENKRSSAQKSHTKRSSITSINAPMPNIESPNVESPTTDTALETSLPPLSKSPNDANPRPLSVFDDLVRNSVANYNVSQTRAAVPPLPEKTIPQVRNVRQSPVQIVQTPSFAVEGKAVTVEATSIGRRKTSLPEAYNHVQTPIKRMHSLQDHHIQNNRSFSPAPQFEKPIREEALVVNPASFQEPPMDLSFEHPLLVDSPGYIPAKNPFKPKKNVQFKEAYNGNLEKRLFVDLERPVCETDAVRPDTLLLTRCT